MKTETITTDISHDGGGDSQVRRRRGSDLPPRLLEPRRLDQRAEAVYLGIQRKHLPGLPTVPARLESAWYKTHIVPLITSSYGRVLNIADGFLLAAYDDAELAITASCAIQRLVDRLNFDAGVDNDLIYLGIGIIVDAPYLSHLSSSAALENAVIDAQRLIPGGEIVLSAPETAPYIQRKDIRLKVLKEDYLYLLEHEHIDRVRFRVFWEHAVREYREGADAGKPPLNTIGFKLKFIAITIVLPIMTVAGLVVFGSLRTSGGLTGLLSNVAQSLGLGVH